MKPFGYSINPLDVSNYQASQLSSKLTIWILNESSMRRNEKKGLRGNDSEEMTARK